MKNTVASREPEIKERIATWLYPSTLEVLDNLVPRDNCKSRSEFIEKAIRFYAGYISGEEATAFLPPALVAAIHGTLDDSENRIARLLFKLAVELSMTMHVLAAGMEIDDKALRKIRGQCVDEVKRTHGSVSLANAVHFSREDDERGETV